MKSFTRLFLLIAILLAIVTPGTYSWAASSSETSKSGASEVTKVGGPTATPLGNTGIDRARKDAEDARKPAKGATKAEAKGPRPTPVPEATNAPSAPPKKAAKVKAERPRSAPPATKKVAEQTKTANKDVAVKINSSKEDGKGFTPEGAAKFLQGFGQPISVGIYADGKGNGQAKAIFAKASPTAPAITPAPKAEKPKELTEGDKVTIGILAVVLAALLLLAILFG